MSIIHSFFPNNAHIECHLETLRRVTNPLLETIALFKEEFVAIGRQREDLLTISKRVLASLDEEIRKEMKKGNIKPIPGKKDVPKKEVEKCAVKQPIQPVQQMVASTNSVRITMREKKKVCPSLRTILFTGVFMCFLCFKENLVKKTQKMYMWQKKEYYLEHLEDKHKICPDFQVLRLGTYNSIPFSHVNLNGNLVNLFKGHEVQPYLQLHNMWEENLRNNIYICSCIKETAQDIPFTLLPIFTKPEGMFDHLDTAHSGVYQHLSTHKVMTNRNSKVFLTLNTYKQDNRLIHCPRVNAAFRDLPALIDKMTSFPVETFLVQAAPEVRLEVISQTNLTWCDVFLRLPGCQKRTPTVMDMKAYLQKHGKSIEKVVNIAGLSEEDSALINLQVSLLKPSVFICGECLDIFSQRKDFIFHITNKHQQISPLNSHIFTFLKSP